MILTVVITCLLLLLIVPIAKGGVACPFPWRLHECLDAVEREGLEHVISWKPHGRAFIVYQPAEFERLVLPR